MVERPPGIDTRVHRDPVGAYEDKLLVEPVGHFRDPLKLDAFGRDDKDPPDEAPCLQLGDDEPSFDRLAQSDLVRQQQPQGVGRQGAVEHGELVGERFNATLGDGQRLAVGHRPPCQAGRGSPCDLLGGPLAVGEGLKLGGGDTFDPTRGWHDDNGDGSAPEFLDGEDRDGLATGGPPGGLFPSPRAVRHCRDRRGAARPGRTPRRGAACRQPRSRRIRGAPKRRRTRPGPLQG